MPPRLHTDRAAADQPETRGPSFAALVAVAKMTRPSHIFLIAILFGNGVLYAAWRDEVPLAQIMPGRTGLWLALGLLILLSMAVHLANEAADHETDRLTKRTPFSGGSGAIAESGLSPRIPMILSMTLAAFVVAATVLAVSSSLLEPPAGLLLVLGLGGGLAYSLPPIAAMRRGIGEPLYALLGGMLPLLGVAALTGVVGPADIVAFLPFTLVVFASVLATAWPDREADRATGKNTMQVRLSPEALRRVAFAIFGGFLAATALSAAIGSMPVALLGLAVVPLMLISLYRYTRATSLLFAVMAMAGHALLTTAVLVATLAKSGASV